MTTAQIVKSSKLCKFSHYREGNFIYKTESGFEFPIPLEETQGITLLAEEKTIFFMRWIRKFLEQNGK